MSTPTLTSSSSVKKKFPKNVEMSPTTTSYIVVMTGAAGTVYQPCQVSSPTLNLSTPNFCATTTTATAAAAATTSISTTQNHRPLTVPGTNIPLPLQPLTSFSPNNVLSAELLATNLPSLDMLCSGIDDCDSALDDIEQVLKDAENFDILA